MDTPKDNPKPEPPNPFDENNNLIVDDPDAPEEHPPHPLKPDDEDVLIAGNQSRQFGA